MTELDRISFSGLEAVIDGCWWHISTIVWAEGDHEPIAGRLTFLALQHGAAALGLLRIEADASASALIRSCADCGARSLYSLLCAGPEELSLFKEDKHAAFGRSFERMVDDVRFHLHGRNFLPLSESHIDGLFLTYASSTHYFQATRMAFSPVFTSGIKTEFERWQKLGAPGSRS